MAARRIIGQFGKKKRTAGHAYLQHDVKVSNARAKNIKRGRGDLSSKPIVKKAAHVRKDNLQKAPTWGRCKHRLARFGQCQRPEGHKSQHTYA